LYTSFYNALNTMKLTLDSMKVDNDSDRVSDYWDRDPVTPKGYKVYGDGTPVDFDADGTPDAIDFCPTVAGPVVNHGCPEQKVEAIEPKKQISEPIKPEITKAEEEIIAEVFKNLQFETGRSIIRQSSFVSLNELANLLKRKPNYKLLIEGHTDNVGGAAANMKLSQDRADAVKKYVSDKGVDSGRLTAIGYGLTRPVADNKTPEGRQQNRRVDFTIIQ
jgi:outer membrane protein OmpA-like peptidoglycan-associated protein